MHPAVEGISPELCGITPEMCSNCVEVALSSRTKFSTMGPLKGYANLPCCLVCRVLSQVKNQQAN